MMQSRYMARKLYPALVLAVFLLPACSVVKKDESAYLHSRLLPPLKIPPGLEAPRTNDFMAIPEITAAQPAPDDGLPIDAPPELRDEAATPSN